MKCPTCGITSTEGDRLLGDERPTLRDQFAMAALTGLLASDMPYEDRTIIVAFAVAKRCMEIRKTMA